MKKVFVLSIVLSVLFISCSSKENESNKEVDIQATIDAAIKIALENLEPTPTIVPTLTPTTQPTPTLTPAPTSIPTAIPEPTATPAPTSTSAPEPTVTSTSAPVPVSEITYEELVNKRGNNSNDEDEDEDNSCYQSKEIDWIERESDSLPLGESFPNAEVTLFFDFDGYGTLHEDGYTTYEKVASYYNLKKQDAIKKTIEQVAGNYAMWGINVTTDRTVFDDAGKRARILVVNRGDYAGRASTDGISTSSKPTGYVDSLSIFKPLERGKCAYLLTHEVGHNFRLRGTTNDYAVDYPDATIGAFMGGRTKDRFTGYQWKRILNKKGEWQDPPEYFQNAINK